MSISQRRLKWSAYGAINKISEVFSTMTCWVQVGEFHVRYFPLCGKCLLGVIIMEGSVRTSRGWACGMIWLAKNSLMVAYFSLSLSIQPPCIPIMLNICWQCSMHKEEGNGELDTVPNFLSAATIFTPSLALSYCPNPCRHFPPPPPYRNLSPLPVPSPLSLSESLRSLYSGTTCSQTPNGDLGAWPLLWLQTQVKNQSCRNLMRNTSQLFQSPPPAGYLSAGDIPISNLSDSKVAFTTYFSPPCDPNYP